MKPKMLTGEEFNKFFNDVVNTALSTRGAPESLHAVMEKHGLTPDLPAPLKEKLMPMLKVNVRGIKDIPHNCSWCGVCGLCSACGELNAAAVGASSAAAVHVLD